MGGIGTASWLEIIWTLAAIPGFYLWTTSWLSAKQSLSAAKQLKTNNGRLLWAKFSVQLTRLMSLIELVFIIIGVISLLRVENPSSNLLTTLIISGGLIGCSILITLLAHQWAAVEEQILSLARARRLEQIAMDKREVSQNTRDTDQNLRTFKQDERDKETGDK